MPIDEALGGLSDVPQEVSEDLIRGVGRTDAELGVALGPREAHCEGGWREVPRTGHRARHASAFVGAPEASGQKTQP